MRKLIENKTTVSSMDLSNVKIDNNSSQDSISETLLSDINTAASKAGLNVTITTAVSGHNKLTKSGHQSRHSNGNAVDISIINGLKINRENGDKLYNELINMGYEKGESGNEKSVLWQVPDHYDHIHISINNDNVLPYNGNGGGENSSPGEEILKKMISGITGINEGKQNRVLKDIQKIKKLL